MNRSMIIALALAASAGVAFAQSSTTPANPNPISQGAAGVGTPTPALNPNSVPTPNGPVSTDQTALSSATTAGGIRMADIADVSAKFVNVQPADMMASKLIGMTLYNNQGESLGKISDLVIDNGKTVTGVIASVGGFLGIGDSYVVLDPATVVVSSKNGDMRAYVDTSKEALNSAPKYTYPKT